MTESSTFENMNKIWFLGDSYVANTGARWLENTHGAKSWTKILTEAFPEYTNENIAIAGSSLDFLYYTYEQRRKEFKSGDIVIMSLTNIERLFLRKLYEDLYFRFLQTGRITSPLAPKGKLLEHLPEDHPWYTYFADDLFNPEAHKANVNLFLNSLQYDAMTKGIKIIALPIVHFPFLDTEDKDHITLGKTKKDMDLYAVSNKQLETKFNHIKFLFWQHEECRTYDKTLSNHLTPRNTEILANKVIRNLKTNEPIDLSTEWEY
jgi:hypothetical protein